MTETLTQIHEAGFMVCFGACMMSMANTPGMPTNGRGLPIVQWLLAGVISAIPVVNWLVAVVLIAGMAMHRRL